VHQSHAARGSLSASEPAAESTSARPYADPVTGSHAAGSLRTFSRTARAIPRIRTAARQRRRRCLADTDLMTRSALSEASIGVVGKSERNLDQRADVGPFEIVG
jgi:hypothetical protein